MKHGEEGVEDIDDEWKNSVHWRIVTHLVRTAHWLQENHRVCVFYTCKGRLACEPLHVHEFTVVTPKQNEKRNQKKKNTLLSFSEDEKMSFLITWSGSFKGVV